MSKTKWYRYSELGPEAQRVVEQDYLDGWPDGTDLNLEQAAEACNDTDEEMYYTIEGIELGDDGDYQYKLELEYEYEQLIGDE